jgi:hypothetical protein
VDLQIPRGRYGRRVFFTLIGLLCITLLLLRFLLVPALYGDQLPSFQGVLDDVLSDLFVGVFAAAALATLLLWLLPRGEKEAVMEIVPAHERGSALDEARVDTDMWWFSGAMGRYTRAVTIPELARLARRTNTTKSVVVQQLDPRDEPACKRYAEYRAGVRTGRDDPNWSANRVRQELYATVLCAYGWKASEPLLEVTVALKHTVSVFRFDLGRRALIITKEDPLEPALRCPENSFFYDAFKEELRLSLSQAQELPGNVRGIPLDQLDREKARMLLEELGLTDSLSDEDIGAIIRMARVRENPYG